MLDRGTLWRHLVNMIERSAPGGNEALCKITMTTFYHKFCGFFGTSDFYNAMLCIRSTSHGPCPSVRPSVRLSVCLSVTSRCSTKRAKRRITQITPHDSPGTLEFSDDKDLHEIRPGSPPTRTPNAGGVGQNRRLSTNNRLYLENGTR